MATIINNNQIYNCLASKYIRVGSNACEQFDRLSGCTNAPALWYKCGDVRPDVVGCPARKIQGAVTSRIPGLICAKNHPSPIDCPPIGSFAKKPTYCKLVT